MNRDTFLFELGHPKHYHMFKALMKHYHNKAINIMVVARDKDVLLKLLDADKVDYSILGPHTDGLFNKIIITPYLLINYLKLLLKHKPKVIFSKASPYAGVLSKFIGIKHIIFPDSDGFKSNNLLVKFSTIVVTPENYNNKYGKKHKRVKHFFENLYLHPDIFTPDKEKLKKYSIDPDSKYAVVRFVGWGAHHDSFDKGFNSKQRDILVDKLTSYAKVYISSEKEIAGKLMRHKLKINPEDIHHVLYYASLYIGDSQTMATESSLLGVPAVRVNSFVGDSDMSNFMLLEKKYKLLYNFSSIDEAIDKAIELLEDSSAKYLWKEKRNHYYHKNTSILREVIEIVDSFVLHRRKLESNQ